MGILIDANVLIYCERTGLDATELRRAGRVEAFISVITASELLHGLARANDPVRKEKRREFVENILGFFPVLPVDLATARIHAQIWANLESRGCMIGSHDCWLAAACLANGHAVLTSNRREFDRIPGLIVQNWPP